MKKRFLCIVIVGIFLILLPLCGFAASNTVHSQEQLISYLTDKAASKPLEISFEYADYLNEYIADSSWMGTALNEAGILSASWSYGAGQCILFNINYMPEHIVCTTENQVLEALRSAQHGAVNLRPSATLYTMLTADNFSLLHELEGKAAIEMRSLSYSSAYRLLMYSDIQYAANFSSVQTLDELKQCLFHHTQALNSEFTIQCTPTLYSQISKNEFELVNTVEENCGIYSRTMTYSDSSKTIAYSDIEYLPGFYVARSIRLGQTARLTGKKLTLYNEAQRILRQINSSQYSDPAELQFALQDAIMSRTTYYKSNTNGEQDTAIGALLNGRAECDGYADAFYLLADMAGFQVVFQAGESYKDSEGHMWNLIRHNDQWYITDVTWCDSDGELNYHFYANIGRDIADKAYIWNEQAALASPAPSSFSRFNYYHRENVLFQNYTDAARYVSQKLRSGSRCVEILVQKPAYEQTEAFVSKVTSALNTSYQTTYKHTDEYVCFIFTPYY